MRQREGIVNSLIVHAHLGVCEKKNSMLVLNTCWIVQYFQIIMEGVVVIATAQLYLETLVATDVGWKSENKVGKVFLKNE